MVFMRRSGFGSGSGSQDRLGLIDDQIQELISTEVANSVCGSTPELFGSIKTTMIELFDDRYATLTETSIIVATLVVPTTRG